MKKPLPPYASRLRPHSNTVWLYFGSHDAWGRAKRAHSLGWLNVLILPPGERPAAYDWSCVAGCSIVAVELEETSPELRHALVYALALDGAKEAYLVPHSKRATEAVMWNCGPARKVAA